MMQSTTRFARMVWVLFAAALVVTLGLSNAAFAQATRTWVSGVGDDVNPCSRTAPCKTFAGAISKTAAGGEIDVLDPGGFGGVTITKSISIEGGGVLAGVLVQGTNAIIVNAGVNDVVVLRGLTIEGVGTGLAGIKFLGGGTLHVENCTINNFVQTGLVFEPGNVGTNVMQLFVKDSIIRDNTGNGGTGPGTTAGGILIKPTGSNTVKASIENVRVEKNWGGGLRAEAGTNVSVSRSIFNGNTNSGVLGTLGAQMLIESSVSSNNANGIKADVGTTTIAISNVTVTNNSVQGLNTSGAGFIKSFGNNHVFGNASDGAPSGVNINPM